MQERKGFKEFEKNFIFFGILGKGAARPALCGANPSGLIAKGKRKWQNYRIL
jgi:hypothetical protein